MANGDKSSYMEHLVHELIKRNWPQAADRKGATNQNHPKPRYASVLKKNPEMPQDLRSCG